VLLEEGGAAVTDHQINIAIAEICAWSHESAPPYSFPDYCNDLNAMHEAEKLLKYDSENTWLTGGYSLFVQALPYGNEIRATSRQRAEAFLRALNKWKEVQP
jgi:hypothetical protein